MAEARTVQSPEIRSRVKELRKKGKAGKLPPPATSYVPKNRRQELRIARRDIVARPVDEASLKRYKKLYEQAAEEYGFGDDWYVLAAVGKVESDHGQNMGPSSAGALGPMQFMPSTWESYGVDANEDGKANIMDPEDAIPSAARYLKAGGAPDDWYEALYTYNHAGWYVEKVLKMAERYRVAAGDDEVGPYYPSGR
ncbi:lytic transglycosylase domain-containing protein [Rubrobacter aplysinae]|uniref:lytic transglycosylase domain-containing protein n=1 Tax=Rubrobacter aplysinae TaxID=909625 RepID=UPI00069E5F09|nr:lytic transglycosylase domain-containing protein [Rubrobacter aplysinae]